MPSFNHTFDPKLADPVGSSADLSLIEIEDAGLMEMLQAPGAALGTWSVFAALLEPGSTAFVFRESLGKSREVKVALSGLFGRFVARAYATKYLGYTHFQHIHSPPMTLASSVKGNVHRTGTGDMPDWVTWGQSVGLGIVEAKGSHHPKGTAEALARAYDQAERAEIRVAGKTAAFKRYAIATRWGFASPTPTDPLLSVKDPAVEGEGVTLAELKEVGLGIVRQHYAALLRPLGYPDLATSLTTMATSRMPRRRNEAQEAARAAVKELVSATEGTSKGLIPERLIGGFVTRGGPLEAGTQLSDQDLARLSELKLAPTFVGVERSALEATIEGDIGSLHYSEKDAAVEDVAPSGRRRRDPSGAWIIRYGEGDAQSA